MIEIIEKLPEGVKSEVMSTLDIFIEEGKAGAKEETCRNLIKLGADNEFICRALEVDEAYVERVREETAQEERGNTEA